MGRQYYTLGTGDIGQPRIRAFGQTWPVSDFLGRVLAQDVGKRVYLSGRILQVENNEQRDRRLGGREHAN